MKQIPVYKKGTLAAWALVDDVDYESAVQWLWKLNPAGYACRYSKLEGTVRMHREFLGLATGDPREGDHINGQRLDNRRCNLRIATHAQNLQNRQGGNRGASSPLRGVALCKQTGRWRAQVMLNGVNHWLGRFDTEKEAATAAAAFRAAHMPFSPEFVLSDRKEVVAA